MSSSLFAATSPSCDRSVAYILQGRYDAAIRQLEGAPSTGVSPASTENLRGLALLLKGNTAEALAAFNRALELDAQLTEARMNRGLALLQSGQPAAASAELDRVWNIAGFPRRADAAYHNAIALDRMGRSKEAEQWLDRARSSDPRLDAALLYTGLLRERRKDWQAAGRAYLDYLKKHPESATAMLRFGITAQRAGRSDVARTYLEKVVEKAPQSLEAVEARKYLVLWE